MRYNAERMTLEAFLRDFALPAALVYVGYKAVKERRPSRPLKRPSGFKTKPACFAGGTPSGDSLTSEQLKEIRDAVDDALAEAPSDLEASALVVWASSDAMAELCPEYSVPEHAHQVTAFRSAHGALWARAHTMAYNWASARVLPQPV